MKGKIGHFDTMLMKRSPDVSGVSLHTDQQSLILGEMMTARNRLQEENQVLRDKLQDAEMMIQLLHLKIEDICPVSRRVVIERRSAHDIPILRSRVGQLTSEGTAHRKFAVEKKKPKSLSRNNAFRNKVAPGKKTFTQNGIGSETAGTCSMGALSSPCGKAQSERWRACSLDSCISESEESHGSKQPPSPEMSRRDLSSPKPSASKFVPHFGERQFPGDARQVRSIVGKLAQVVLNEYSNCSDDDDIIFE